MTNVIEMVRFESSKRLDRMKRMAAFFDLKPERQPDGRWLLLNTLGLQAGQPFDREARAIGGIIDMLEMMLRDHQSNEECISIYPMVTITATGDRHSVDVWWTPDRFEAIADNLSIDAAISLYKAEVARAAAVRHQRIAEVLT